MGIVIKKRRITSKNNYNIQDGSGKNKYDSAINYKGKKPSGTTKFFSKALAAKTAVGSQFTSRFSRWKAKRKEKSASLNYAKKMNPTSVKRTWYGVRKFTSNSSKFKLDITQFKNNSNTIGRLESEIKKDKIKSNPFELQKAKRFLDEIQSKQMKKVAKLTKKFKENPNGTYSKNLVDAQKKLEEIKTSKQNIDTNISTKLTEIQSAHKQSLENKQSANTKYIDSKAQKKIVSSELGILKKQLEKSTDIGRIEKLQESINEKGKLLETIEKELTPEKKTAYKDKSQTNKALNALKLLNKSSKYSRSIAKQNKRVKSTIGEIYKDSEKDYLKTFAEAKEKGKGSWATLGKLAKESTTGRILASPLAFKKNFVRGVNIIRRGASYLYRKSKLNTIGRGSKFVLRSLARVTPLRWMGVKSVNHIAKQKLAKTLIETNKINKNINTVETNLKRITGQLQNINSNPFATHSDIEKRKLEKEKEKYINEYQNLKSTSKLLVRELDSIKSNLPNAIEISSKVEKNINSLKDIGDISKSLNTMSGDGATPLLNKLGLDKNSVNGINNLVENLKDPNQPINNSHIKSSIDNIMNIDKKITNALSNSSLEDKTKLFELKNELQTQKENLQKLYNNNNKLQEFTTNKQTIITTRTDLKKRTKLASVNKISSTSINSTLNTKNVKKKQELNTNIFSKMNINFDSNLTKLPRGNININNRNIDLQTIINREPLLKGLTTEGHKDSIVINNIIQNLQNKNYIDKTDFLHEIKQKYVAYKLEEMNTNK
jgi:hypothetical protein